MNVEKPMTMYADVKLAKTKIKTVKITPNLRKFSSRDHSAIES